LAQIESAGPGVLEFKKLHGISGIGPKGGRIVHDFREEQAREVLLRKELRFDQRTPVSTVLAASADDGMDIDRNWAGVRDCFGGNCASSGSSNFEVRSERVAGGFAGSVSR